MGPGRYDGHLHDDVVKALGTQARQAGHLGAAFHLEHADGVGPLQGVVNRGIAGGQLREIHVLLIGVADDPDGILQHRHHAQAEQIHFDEPEIGAVLFIPLDDDAAGHGGRFERHDLVEVPLADDQPAGVLSQVAGQILNGGEQFQKLADLFAADVEAGVAEHGFGVHGGVVPAPVRDHARQLFECTCIEAQRFPCPRRARQSARDR